MEKYTVKQKKFIKKYWDYYYELERQLRSIEKYISFEKSNYRTYSVELLKLYLSICGEIDSLAKVICLEFEPSAQVKDYNVHRWGYVIGLKFNDFNTKKVLFNDEIEIIPFDKFENRMVTTINKDGNTSSRFYLKDRTCKTPVWWTSYNKVKHQRTIGLDSNEDNFVLANLSNVIESLSALYVLETWFAVKVLGLSMEDVKSKLFKIVI